MQIELFGNPKRVAMSRVELLLAIAERMGHYIHLAEGCCEPGYDDKPVALGNWNSRTKYDKETNTHETLDETMPRLAKLFERLGYVVEWEDEWCTCEDCCKAFRNSPDSYSWKPYYLMGDGWVVCRNCVENDPESYLEEYVGNPSKCLTFDIDLEQFGYLLHSGDHESGYHPGQNANPEEIAKQLREEKIDDFIFVLDENSQFYSSFSVWVKLGEDGGDD